MSEPEAKARVQSVDRALDLLEALSRDGRLGVSDLAQRTGLALGTVHRLLGTLIDRGYVRQHPDRKYTIGAAALALTDPGQQAIADLGQPYIRELTATFGESANIAVLQGHSMTYVAQSASPHALRIFAEVGRQVPLHSTAIGKAILSTHSDEQAIDLLGAPPWRAATVHTLTTANALVSALAAIRAQGFAIDDQEQELGVRCVAAPVHIRRDEPARIAVSVSGPTERFSQADALEAASTVTTIAAQFARALDGR